MSLEYAIEMLNEKFVNKEINERVIIDLKIIKDASNFFESDIKNHCRFTINGPVLEIIQNIEGEPEEEANIVVYSKEDTAIKILEGSLDPLQAFMKNELRVEGDTKIAIEVAKLAS